MKKSELDLRLFSRTVSREKGKSALDLRLVFWVFLFVAARTMSREKGKSALDFRVVSPDSVLLKKKVSPHCMFGCLYTVLLCPVKKASPHWMFGCFHIVQAPAERYMLMAGKEVLGSEGGRVGGGGGGAGGEGVSAVGLRGRGRGE